MIDCLTPQRIVQHGEARSASTFQWYLLCSILRVCRASQRRDVPPPKVICSSRRAETHVQGHERFALQFSPRPPKGVKVKPITLVQKTHSRPSYPARRTVYFTSSHLPQKLLPYSVVHQHYAELVRSPLAAVEAYAPVFNLTREMVREVQMHLRWWMIIRQCCGYQSSQDHRNQLHGFAGRRHAEFDYDYVNCDVYQLSVVERAFLSTRLARQYIPWIQFVREDVSLLRDTSVSPGFCNRTNADIRRGMDFNRRWLNAPPPPPPSISIL